MSKAWILVTDAARARLFETAERNDRLVEIACYTHPDLRGEQTHHAGRRLPRTHENAGPSSRATEPHASRRDKSLQQFAHSLSTVLDSGYAHHQYEWLFLIAPPRLLGALRENLGDPFAKGLVGEIGNDLIDLHPDELFHYVHTKYPREFRAMRTHALPRRIVASRAAPDRG
jgi:protein required for attachment to host cells